MKNTNKKGFTLIELLAVIVILGVIMVIAIPAMTGYIANSRKDTMLSSAQEFVNAARTLLISENALPTYKKAVVVPIDIIEVDKGGVSPFNNRPFVNSGTASDKQASYVLVFNDADSAVEVTGKSYKYAIALTDDEANCLDLISEEYLTTQSTRQKRKRVKNSECFATYIAEDKTTTTPFIVDATAADTGTKWEPTSVEFYNE